MHIKRHATARISTGSENIRDRDADLKTKKGIVAIRNAAQLSLDVSVALNPPVRKYEKVEIKLSLAIAVVIIPFIPRINEIIRGCS